MSGRAATTPRARVWSSTPAFLDLCPRHGAVAPKVELVDLVARPHADRVAVRIDGDERLLRAGEQERPCRRSAPVDDLVRSARAGLEADEVSAFQRPLAVGLAQDDRSVDDEEPLLGVLVVVRTPLLTRCQVVDVHRRRRGSERAGDVDPALEVLCGEDVDHSRAVSMNWRGTIRAGQSPVELREGPPDGGPSRVLDPEAALEPAPMTMDSRPLCLLSYLGVVLSV